MVVVVGGGLAGLTAARTLMDDGHRVQVLEAAPSPGGRLATGELAGERIDEGAAEFSVRTPGFQSWLAPWVANGTVASRPGRLHRWDGHQLVATPLSASPRRWIAPEGMQRLVARLAEGLDVRCGVRVTALSAGQGRWQVAAEAVQAEADAIVMALPAPQALTLALSAREAFAPATLRDLGRVAFDPVLVVAAAYPAAQPGWTTVEVEDGVLLRLHATSSATTTRVVLHARGDWSRVAFDRADPAIIEPLLVEAARVGGAWLANPTEARVVRWRHGLPTLLAPARYLLSEGAAPAVFCGDWCVGARVEAAFLSGQMAAERLALRG